MDFLLDNEYIPIKTLRRQSRAVLETPTESFEGKKVLITGASGLICSRVASILIDLNADTLIFAVPDIPEGPDGVPQLEALLGPDRVKRARVFVWHLDLLSFESVRALAARVTELPRLDVALMGAAIITTRRKVSQDGWEYSTIRPCLVSRGITWLTAEQPCRSTTSLVLSSPFSSPPSCSGQQRHMAQPPS